MATNPKTPPLGSPTDHCRPIHHLLTADKQNHPSGVDGVSKWSLSPKTPPFGPPTDHCRPIHHSWLLATRTTPPLQPVSQNGRYNRRHHLLVHLLYLSPLATCLGLPLGTPQALPLATPMASPLATPTWVYLWPHPWLNLWPRLPGFTFGLASPLATPAWLHLWPCPWLNLWPHLPGFTFGLASPLATGSSLAPGPLKPQKLSAPIINNPIL